MRLLRQEIILTMELEAALSMKEAKHLCNTILLPTILTVPMVGEQLLQPLVLNVSFIFFPYSYFRWCNVSRNVESR